MPTLEIPLISKKYPNKRSYRLGVVADVQQYVFNDENLTQEFFADAPSSVIKLSNTQEFFFETKY